MKRYRAALALAILLAQTAWADGQSGEGIFIEAESFSSKGGWCVDQQFMDRMGSPYLIAHGLGKPVEDAVTTVEIPRNGTYHVWVRTYNWTSPWTSTQGLEPSGSRSTGNR